jgi:hypothetical protein
MAMACSRRCRFAAAHSCMRGRLRSAADVLPASSAPSSHLLRKSDQDCFALGPLAPGPNLGASNPDVFSTFLMKRDSSTMLPSSIACFSCSVVERHKLTPFVKANFETISHLRFKG